MGVGVVIECSVVRGQIAIISLDNLRPGKHRALNAILIWNTVFSPIHMSKSTGFNPGLPEINRLHAYQCFLCSSHICYRWARYSAHCLGVAYAVV